MNKIFLTSDTHFNHKSICGPSISKWETGYRNFSSLKEMEDCMIENINDLVEPDDILYHLGDFMMGPNQDSELPRIRNRILCKTIHHIPGNHNKFKKWPELTNNFSSVQLRYNLRYKGYLIVMDHYPIASWEEMGNGSLHAYGHCHGNYKHHGRSVDVGVDFWNFNPIPIDFFIDECLAKEIVKVDHH